mgnify:CR=1 FL=1
MICPYCTKQYKLQSALNKHINNKHINKQIIKCKHCSKQYTTQNNLIKHVKNVHSESLKINSLCCPYCSKQYKLSKYLQKHINEKHVNISKIQCKFCDKTYITQTNLNKHVNNKHQNKIIVTKFKCPQCFKEYKLKSAMDKHINSKHQLGVASISNNKMIDNIFPSKIYDDTIKDDKIITNIKDNLMELDTIKDDKIITNIKDTVTLNNAEDLIEFDIEPIFKEKILFFPRNFGFVNALSVLLLNIFVPLLTFGLMFQGIGFIFFGYKNKKILHIGIILMIVDFMGATVSLVLVYFYIGIILLPITPIITGGISLLYSLILLKINYNK